MFIQTETTPNPSTLKFLPGKTVMLKGTANFANEEESQKSPLAHALFMIKDVQSVFFGADFISVTKADGEWIPNIKWETTVTQATINGGQAERLNAFVDMTYAQKVHGFYK